MKEFDTDKLNVAMVYIKRMADGRNPVLNQQVENDILDNPNVIRCLNFVSEVLEEVWENHGLVGKKYSRSKEDFPLEVLEQFEYRRDKPVSHVLKQFEEPVQERNIRKISASMVNQWLAENGYIEKRMIEESGKESWFPLQKGEDIGLYTEKRGEPGYQYVTIMYSKEAQQFLADHLGQIIEEKRRSKKSDR